MINKVINGVNSLTMDPDAINCFLNNYLGWLDNISESGR